MLQDLIRHKGFADASLLREICRNGTALQDTELRTLLHHIILANRFWLMLILGGPFNIEEESRTPESLEAIAIQYRETHAQELQWVYQAQQTDLDRVLQSPLLPGRSVSIAQALVQVCFHSHGHRAQCAAKLRMLGGTPPATDFVHWLKDRPAADWSW